MPQYKLTYYDLQGLGEPIRYMFAVAGVEYEDNRIPKDDTTYPKLPANIKDALPWGSLPLLEVDDGKHRIAQSAAIFRFLAKRFNLYGADEFEAAKCDEIAEAVKDFAKEWHALVHPTDDGKKAEVMKKLQEVTIPYYMGRFNKIAEANGKWLVGKNLTWIDIGMVHYMSLIANRTKVQLVDGYPAIKKLMEDVYSVPQIKAWIAKRPVTE